MTLARKITVRVTRDHIGHAIRQTSTQCAVAIALKDAGDFYRPVVTQEKIKFTDMTTGLRYEFDTPPKIAELIERFDALGPQTAKPASFTIDLDEATKVTPIKRRQPSELLEQAKKDRERRARGATSNVYRSFREIRTTDV